MRILYVEDNQANFLLVQRIARMGNHEVVNYVSAEDALRNLDRENPDLLLVDLQLAGEMDGVEFVRLVRSAGYRTPAIAVTAFGMPGERERCFAVGFDDFIDKPVPVNALVSWLQG